MSGLKLIQEQSFDAISQAVSSTSNASAFLIKGVLLPSEIKQIQKSSQVPVLHAVNLFYPSNHTLLSGSASFHQEAAQLLGKVEGENLTIVGEEPYFASAVRLLEDASRLGQTALSAEAMAIGVKTGLSTRMIFSAIHSAIGSSWSWDEQVSKMLDEEYQGSSGDSIAEAVTTLSRYAAESKLNKFSSPLIALIRQQYISALPRGQESTASLLKNYNVSAKESPSEKETEEKVAEEPGFADCKVGFIGLGSMGLGMASILHKAGCDITGFDVYKGSLDKFEAVGGKIMDTAEGAAQDAKVVVLMVVSAAQAEEVLFEKGVAAAMTQGGVVLLMSTVPPSVAISIQEKLQASRSDLHLLDCPVSGGVARAALGDLTILCGGEAAAIEVARPVLASMSGTKGNAANLWIIPGGVGKGSAVKMTHQALAGTSINLVTELMSFAARLGLPVALTREILLKSSARSGMLLTRGKNMIEGKLKPDSTVDIWLKDLNIVTDEAELLQVPVWYSSYVLQANVLASSFGWGLDDDSSLTRLWGQAGIQVAQS